MKSTSSVASIIQHTTVATGVNKLKPTATDNCTPKEADLLFTDLSDLTNPNFRLWYCQRFHGLPRTKILELAAQARADGKDPAKLFSFLLKKA